MNLVETYAPTLTHLHDQLREHDSVIVGWSAGPQPGTKDLNLWGAEPYILLQVEDPYQRSGKPDVIVIRSELIARSSLIMARRSQSPSTTFWLT